MTLIKELIEIPERVHQGDFVLKLTEGVKQAEATLGHYVVTPQLARAFDESLALSKRRWSRVRARRPIFTAHSAPASRTSWQCCIC